MALRSSCVFIAPQVSDGGRGKDKRSFYVVYQHNRSSRIKPKSSNIFARRSANYHPTLWDYSYLQLLENNFTGNRQTRQIQKLKGHASRILYREKNPEAILMLVNALQQLGLYHHFEEEIKDVLSSMLHGTADQTVLRLDLHSTSLLFKLLRENWFHTSHDVFSYYKDSTGNFKNSLCGDAQGLLSLFEASHLAFDGENLMDEARKFAVQHLNGLSASMDVDLRERVVLALKCPPYWRVSRLEARRFIEQHEHKADMEPVFLWLAKLDFNMVQNLHQQEISTLTRWWEDLGLVEKLSFTRDRLVECFFFAAGVVSDPNDGYCREEVAKVCNLITTMDDMYDIYGSLDELTLFTRLVERWELSAMEELPQYMKIYYSALLNTINKLASDVQKQQGLDILPYLKKAWADLCKAFLVEAQWHCNNYTPTLKEYIENGWISASGHVVLFHAFLLSRKDITKEALQCLNNYPDFIKSSSLIFRLCNDLATSSAEIERGDTSASIQCYMHEHGVSEAVAHEAIKDLVQSTLKNLNREVANCDPLLRRLANAAINLARISHCVYQNGDGIGAPDQDMKIQIKLLFFEPIELESNIVS